MFPSIKMKHQTLCERESETISKTQKDDKISFNAQLLS